MRRTVILDANVFDQMMRNNSEVARRLRRLVRSGARVYISTAAEAELTGGISGVLFGGRGKNRRTNPGGIGPDDAQVARTHQLMIHRFGVHLAPPTTSQARAEVYRHPTTAASMQPSDAVTVAEARALGAELWTMERGDRLRRAAATVGVQIAQESNIPRSERQGSHLNGLRLAGLKNYRISANGAVTIMPASWRGGSFGRPPSTPSPSRTNGKGNESVARRMVKAGALQLAFEGVNFVLHTFNNALEARKVREAWEARQPDILRALRNNPGNGALVLFVYTQRRKVRQEQDSILDPLREYRSIRIGYGPDRKSAMNVVASEARAEKTAHGSADYEVVTETLWIPPEKPQASRDLSPPFRAYARATFAPGKARLQRVFYSALGFDDGAEIELSAPSSVTPEFYLLTLPTTLRWVEDGGFGTRDLDVVWVRPHNYIFLERIQTIDLDPWVGVGGTKAAMVYPANEETRLLFGSRGVTDDKDGLLRRCDPGFLDVQWVRPEHIDILQDFRELEGDSRRDRKTVESGRESPKHWTPEVGGFNMEEDANRPRIFRD